MRQCVFVAGLVLIVVLVAQGCGGNTATPDTGLMKEEERKLRGVSGVELATLGNLFIELGEEEKLRIVAEGHLLQYFETGVRDGVLEIRLREGVNLSPSQPINFYLTVRQLHTIVLSSIGDVRAPELKAQQFTVNLSSMGELTLDSLEAEQVMIEISGSGDAVIDRLTANNLEVELSSMGNLEIAGGTVGEQKITVSGSGNYKAANLESGPVELYLSSMGSARLGDVKGEGEDAVVRVNVNGSGGVTMGSLVADRLEVELTSMGGLDITVGSIREQIITLTGSGDYRAEDVGSDRAEVYLSSMGSATIRVRDSLKVELSGSGSVRYVGVPAVDKIVTGMGEVEQIRE